MRKSASEKRLPVASQPSRQTEEEFIASRRRLFSPSHTLLLISAKPLQPDAYSAAMPLSRPQRRISQSRTCTLVLSMTFSAATEQSRSVQPSSVRRVHCQAFTAVTPQPKSSQRRTATSSQPSQYSTSPQQKAGSPRWPSVSPSSVTLRHPRSVKTLAVASSVEIRQPPSRTDLIVSPSTPRISSAYSPPPNGTQV